MPRTTKDRQQQAHGDFMSDNQTASSPGKASQIVTQFLQFLSYGPEMAAGFTDRLRKRMGTVGIITAFDAVLAGGSAPDSMIDDLLSAAVIAEENGDQSGAKAYLDLARKIAPEDSRVLHDWAAIQFKLGNVAEALTAFRQALAAGLQNPEATLNLAIALVGMDQHTEARALLTDLAAEASPLGAQALLVLAKLDLAELKPAEARSKLEQALRLDPKSKGVLGALASQEYVLEDFKAGAAWLRQALDHHPTDNKLWTQLGEMLFRAKDHAGAEDAFREAFALKSLPGDAAHVCHVVFHRRGRQALWTLADELATKVDSRKDFYSLLGHLLYQDYASVEAMTAFQYAFQEDPTDKSILTGIAAIIRMSGDAMKSREFLEWAMASMEDSPTVWQGLGTTLYETGAHDQAVDVLMNAARRWPDSIEIIGTLLLAMHYQPTATVEQMRAVGELLADAGDRKYGGLAQHWNPRPPGQGDRLNIGFMSGGFRNHPVGHFARGLLEHIDKSRFRVVLLDSGTERDATTDIFFKLADEVVDLTVMSDPMAVARARSLNLDVFIDLAGCFQGARLALPVSRVAPVQMKWVGGLCGTTGVRQFDYVISDWIESPAGAEAAFVERSVYRLPHDYVSYMPSAITPEVRPLPALENGFVTFGCLNNYAKLNDPLLDAWARILHACPDSRLLLLSLQYGNPKIVEALKGRLYERGITPDRIECIGKSPHRVVLQTYGRIDVALDPTPYSGGLTTCEALYMGVPVVTAPQASFASRHSASHLVNAGLGEFVCATMDRYVEVAVATARDLDRLATLRAGLRSRMQASPLMDHARFARDFEDMLFAVTGKTR